MTSIRRPSFLGRLLTAALFAGSAATFSGCASGFIGSGNTDDGEDHSAVVGGLQVYFLDVGQGDSTLIIGPKGSAVLFDGGPRAAEDTVRRAVKSLANGRLKGVFLSHTDADHLGGIVGLLRGEDGTAGNGDDMVPGTRFIGHDDQSCTSQVCAEFRTLSAYPFVEPEVGEVLDLDGAILAVVARDGDAGGGAVSGVDDPNERSLAVIIEYAGRRIFIGGDLTGGGKSTADVEDAVGAVVGPVDVLRLNHHGSGTSSAATFLSALHPRAVLISEGTDNSYCHPEAAVLARVATLGVPIYSTGAGVVDDADRCGGATAWPSQARPGLGTFSVVVSEDGTLTVAGDKL